MELKLGSIPVRITGRFLFMALILGINELDFAKLGIWVAVVLVSVVVHELGHALMGKAFGLQPAIELHGMGGHTTFSAPRTAGDPDRMKMGTGKSVAISLAGPFAGFFFAALLFAAQVFGGLHPGHPLARHAISLLFAVNIGWGIFNLLPMLPLDGGNVMRSILTALSSSKGDKIARMISIAIAGAIALFAVSRSQWWVLYLGVLFGFQNVQALRQADQNRVDQALAHAIEASYHALDQRDAKQAIALLAPTLVPSATPELFQVGLRIYVVALLKEARFDDALGVIERDRRFITTEDLALYTRTLRDMGRGEDADRLDALKPAPTLSEFRV